MGCRADALYRLVRVSIAEKLGGWLLNILTFASNRTRRDDTWVDDEEYDDEYDEETDGVQRESRRARILRGALARRKRLAEKFSNPRGRQTDAALFSGKRMDDDEDIQYSARGVAADPDDVLFSGNRATQPEYDEYDPLLNGHSVTEPVAAAAAATAVTQTWAASADPIMQTPPMPGLSRLSRNRPWSGSPYRGRKPANRLSRLRRRVSAVSAICSTARGAKCAVAATCACRFRAAIRRDASDRSRI